MKKKPKRFECWWRMGLLVVLWGVGLRGWGQGPVSPVLPQWSETTFAWGDYDGDSDPDLYLSGYDNLGVLQGAILALSGSTLTVDAGQTVKAVMHGDAQWIDWDGDSDLDLAVMGDTARKRPAILLYENVAGTLTLLNAGLPGLGDGEMVWGDFDQDGDLDMAVAGWHPVDLYAGYWIVNEGGGNFSERGAVELEGLYAPRLACGDLDGDGKVDVVVGGSKPFGGSSLRVWRNLGGMQWDSVGHFMPGLTLGNVDIGQFDGVDGMELVVIGARPNPRIDVATWNVGQMQVIPLIGDGLAFSVAKWGDFDADGKVDLVTGGRVSTNNSTGIYRNSGGGSMASFQASPDLPALYNVKFEWVDWDGDSQLDFMMSGMQDNEVWLNVMMTYDNGLGEFIY